MPETEHTRSLNNDVSSNRMIVAVTREQDFTEVITLLGRQAVISNGYIRKLEFFSVDSNISREDLEAFINYFNCILYAMTRTKHEKTKYDHDHRTTAEKKPKQAIIPLHIDAHEFNGSAKLCGMCGQIKSAGCHLKTLGGVR